MRIAIIDISNMASNNDSKMSSGMSLWIILSALVLMWPNCVLSLDGDIRLADGFSPYEGRVEIYYDGQWGTVCDDDWDDLDAQVVCRQLGYSGGSRVSYPAFGSGSGTIWLDDVGCYGWESRLEYCPNRGWGVNNCVHSEDAGVSCTATGLEGSVRLVNGNSVYEGRVEIYHDGEWGTVCDDSWDDSDAIVVCRQLGYSTDNAQARTDGYYGQGTGSIYLDEVSCLGYESFLTQCSNDGWGVHDCGHSEDAGVYCVPSDGDIRLANGSRPHEGRVEIYHDSQWGTICDDGWTGTDASVVCRQLGYSGGFARTNLQFGSGFGPIWLDDVACSGFESRLEDCLNSGWNNHNCVHSEDAGVSCTAIEGDITLVDLNGNSNILEGRVEIFYNGDWGTICDDDWGNSDARVVCRQLGYVLGEGEAKSGGSYGVGSGPIHLDGMDCSGFESVLTQCDNNGWGIHNCIHSEDAGVDCSVSEGTVRLVDGYDEYEGRVEILHDGQWGTVCDDSWGDFDARVVCRQLGYSTDNAQAMIGGVYGRGTGPIYLDEVGCLGHESSLTDCSNTGWGVHNCVHSEDAGVQCGGRLEGSIRLVGGNSLYEGRVEIYHAGQWGTICDNSWGDSEARAVCRQLGYPTYEAQARTGAEYGQGTGSIHLDDVVCFGYEAYLTDCSKGEWGVNYCVHSDDAGVQCVSTTVPPPVNPLHSRIVGIMSFVGVSLSLLTLFSIVAVWYTCSRPKPVTNPTTSQQIPLGNVTSHPAAHNTPASPATNGMTYPTQVATQPAIQPPPAPQQTLNSNPYPPETTARSGSSPPEYMSIVDSQTDSMPPPN